MPHVRIRKKSELKTEREVVDAMIAAIDGAKKEVIIVCGDMGGVGKTRADFREVR